MSTYTIEDEHGTALTTGLQVNDRPYDVAQRMADKRGSAVHLWEPGEDEATKVEPSK